MAPKVSIGLPVYNGQAYLRYAVDSILQQTFGDYELILSDNSSTDETPDICSDYANSDARIRFVRSPINRGAAWNFNRVVELAQGQYFKWMAHDDICNKHLLETCVGILDENPEVVNCYSRVIDIDETGEFQKQRDSLLHTESPDPSRRFKDLVCINHSCLAIFGLIRMNTLKKTLLMQPYVGSDRVLLVELALHGPFYQIPESLLLHREHAKRSTRMIPSLQQRIAWFCPSKSGKLTFPNWRILREYVRVLRRSHVSFGTRLLCHLHTLRWIRRNYSALYSDLSYAAHWHQIRKQYSNATYNTDIVRTIG